jgi:hypothetical protein
MKKDNLDNWFEENCNNWDFKELNSNHNELFLSKLKSNKKRKRNYFIPFAVAASLLLLVGISFFFNNNNKTQKLQFASVETRQTDSIFTVLIEKELIKIKQKKSPENEIMIADALKQMKILDGDYQNIIQELKNNGESKTIIMALITNLQTRISFLQSVLQHIEENQKINNFSDEKTF